MEDPHSIHQHRCQISPFLWPGSAGFLIRLNKRICTSPLIHHVQNCSTVVLKIFPHHVAPQAVAHIIFLQPIEHCIPDRAQLNEGFVRLPSSQCEFGFVTRFSTRGEILKWIGGEDQRLNADKHGKDAGFGPLPFGFGRTWPGAKEAKAYYFDFCE